METKELKSILERHIAAQDYISIVKQGEDEPSRCIPLAASEKLLLGVSFQDFCPDGYVIVPLDRIISIDCSEVDVFFGDIVKKEGALRHIDAAPQLDLADWPAVLRFPKETGEIAILDNAEEGYLEIGKVMNITPDGAEIRCFSPVGVWDDENTFVPYDSLTAIELRSHYIETFSKYLPQIG